MVSDFFFIIIKLTVKLFVKFLFYFADSVYLSEVIFCNKKPKKKHIAFNVPKFIIIHEFPFKK